MSHRIATERPQLVVGLGNEDCPAASSPDRFDVCVGIVYQRARGVASRSLCLAGTYM